MQLPFPTFYNSGLLVYKKNRVVKTTRVRIAILNAKNYKASVETKAGI